MEQNRYERGWSIGKVIRNLREKQQISLEQLSKGLCSTLTLAGMECGEREINMLLAQRILERLGHQPDTYEICNSRVELEQYKKRSEISELRNQKDFLQMEKILAKYEEEVKQSEDNLQMQFVKSRRGILEAEKGEIEKGISLIKEAISLTAPEWEGERFFQLVLGFGELELFSMLADIYEKSEEKKKAYRIRMNLLNYLDLKFLDLKSLKSKDSIRKKGKKEQLAELYGYVVYKIVPYMLECGMAQEGVEWCKKGLKIVSATFRMNYYCELLCWEGKCIEELYRHKKAGRQEVIKIYERAYYICGIYEKWEMAQKLKLYLKEEFDWECIG